MASSQAPLAPIEKHLQAFLGALGTDVDSQAAVFNLDHAWMDVQATMEGLALRPHDLTHAGFVLLMTLWITGPRETRELAAVLRVTKGAIVGSVNTLERRGLVERERSMIDKRLVTVQKEWRALEVEVTSALTVAEKRTLAGLCRKVGESARAVRKRHGSVPALPDPHEFLNETTTNGTPAKARAG
jgi:DNA-binding MarR family transcriptional regulator